jgi:hypothetical protein
MKREIVKVTLNDTDMNSKVTWNGRHKFIHKIVKAKANEHHTTYRLDEGYSYTKADLTKAIERWVSDKADVLTFEVTGE